MADATTPIGGLVAPAGVVKCPIAAALKAIKGTFMFSNASGHAVMPADTANFKNVGVVKDTVDNSAGAAAAKTAEFYTAGIFKFTAAGLTQADIGKKVYAADNQTVQVAALTNVGAMGVIVEVISATECLVELARF